MRKLRKSEKKPVLTFETFKTFKTKFGSPKLIKIMREANIMGKFSRPGAADFADTRKKSPPPVETNAEIFYYKKQIDSHTPMVIVLTDGEQIEGTIEWYDIEALKINRKNAPNVLLLKHNIKYMYKAEEKR